MEEQTSHQKREIKREQREKEQKQKYSNNSETKSKIKKYTISIILLALIIFGLYKLFITAKNVQPYTSVPVHWHANFEVYICGEKQDFTKGFDFEEDNKGTLMTHTHNDNIMHIEDKIIKKEDIALGKFFDRIGVPFSENTIMNKKNGDLCPNGKTGTVHMIVNGMENKEYRNFIPKSCTSPNIQQDCDKIEIRFE